MNSQKRLPSLRALRTFQVVGKYLSLKEAADELCITASAVSHQIKGLEEHLGIELLIRKTRALEFTQAGKHYYDYLSEMFARLESETHQLWAEYGRKIIRISVPPFFASEKLLPKLDALNSLIPDTDVLLSTPPSGMKDHPAEADLSILLGNDNWPNMVTYPLFAGHLVVAAAPSLMKDFDNSSFKSLNGQTLIVHENRPEGWSNWAKAVGIPQPKAGKVLRFDSMSSIMQAVSRGLGFAIVYWPLSDNWFGDGQIVRVYDTKTITDEYFYVAHRPEDSKRPGIKKISEWLQYELKHDG
ncbi:MAG: LysR family transcriptional regulator [Enterobacterales bacterium]|nr:LysR family transcriptional regulator [Enterobacterales bacterium]